jgi:hypothetical protein
VDKSLHIHHVYHSGANKKYYTTVLGYINNHDYDISVNMSPLGEFIEKGVLDNTDVLSYQTFPDEFNTRKFNPKVIDKSDSIFNTFKGFKILSDAHDCGDKDAYTRMPKGKEIPRVKCFPTKWFLKNYNVILTSTVSADPKTFYDKFNRDIIISCKFGHKDNGYYGHVIRKSVVSYLQESFNDITDFEWMPIKSEYFKQLQKTMIVIGAPGWGRYNGSYWGAMQAGAMLFAYTALNDIKLFPHTDLVDGDDFVSYDMFNFKTKLNRILNNPDEINRIRNNGRFKFAKGLDYKKSADQLVQFLKGEIK